MVIFEFLIELSKYEQVNYFYLHANLHGPESSILKIHSVNLLFSSQNEHFCLGLALEPLTQSSNDFFLIYKAHYGAGFQRSFINPSCVLSKLSEEI